MLCYMDGRDTDPTPTDMVQAMQESYDEGVTMGLEQPKDMTGECLISDN
ncbi:MAG: hypothetical protein IJ604_02000 [Prevotella sp.]|nr:hypothetical protein [Prevotella sp.]MBR1462139.1 hypothetical protein [Prevotella sp.]